MDRKRLFLYICYLVLFIFVINYLALQLHWYYTIWWFDIPMHFLGGFWLALGFMWLFNTQEFSVKTTLSILISVVIIGSLWEIFEILVDNNLAKGPFNLTDTISDLFNDLSGGIVAILYYSRRIVKLS